MHCIHRLQVWTEEDGAIVYSTVRSPVRLVALACSAPPKQPWQIRTPRCVLHLLLARHNVDARKSRMCRKVSPRFVLITIYSSVFSVARAGTECGTAICASKARVPARLTETSRIFTRCPLFRSSSCMFVKLVTRRDVGMHIRIELIGLVQKEIYKGVGSV